MRRSISEHGFTTAWILILVLIILMLGFAFYDIAMGLVDRQKLVQAADRAANAGATAIDEQHVIDSDGTQIWLEKTEAESRCRSSLASEGLTSLMDLSSSSCTALNDQINVTVKGSRQMLGSITQNFEITTSGRPTCSDSTDPGGNC